MLVDVGTTWDAVVLAGGRARRLGGVDKPALVIGETSLLELVLAATAGARIRVVVGPRRPTKAPVEWTREDPPGSGPLAALGAGLAMLPTGSDVVVVLAADLPSIDAGLIMQLLIAIPAGDVVDGAIVVDAEGRVQPLLAAYRRGPLQHALEALGVLRDRPVHELLGRLTLAKIVAAGAAAADIDTPADLARWTRNRHGRP